MLYGELLFKSTDAVYTVSERRGGKNGLFSVDVVQLESSATLDIDIEHKNPNETSWKTAASFTQITAKGLAKKEATSLDEQVRLKCTIGGSTGAWVRVIFVDVVWYG